MDKAVPVVVTAVILYITQCAAKLTLQDVLGSSSHVNQIIQQCQDGEGYTRLGPEVKNDPRSLLDMDPPQLLDNFANPCWLECLPSNKSAVYLDLDRVNHVRLRPQMEILNDMIQQSKRVWRLRCLPKFYMIGFPKCGTTDLFLKILAHPDVTLMGGKEIRYWSTKSRYQNEVFGLERYLDETDLATQRILKRIRFTQHSMELYHPMIFGDGSPGTVFITKKWEKYIQAQIQEMQALGNTNYSTLELNLTPKHLHHIQPGALMILMLRNPVTMTFSSYKFFHSAPTMKEFRTCTLQALDVMMQCEQQFGIEWCSYDPKLSFGHFGKLRCKFILRSLQIGRYYVFIRSWLKYFPIEQFHFVRLEDTFHESKNVLSEIWDFLGLGPTLESELFSASRLPSVNVNHKDIGEMSTETRTLLHAYFEPANKELVAITGNNKFLWPEHD